MYNEYSNVTLTVLSVFNIFHYFSQRSSFLGTIYQFLPLALPQCCWKSSYPQKNESGQDKGPHCPVATCDRPPFMVLLFSVTIFGFLVVCTIITSYESLRSVPITASYSNHPCALKRSSKILSQWTSKSFSHKSQQITLFNLTLLCRLMRHVVHKSGEEHKDPS